MTGFSYLLPYDFSPVTLLGFVLALGFYGTGLLLMPERERPGCGRILVFVTGILLCYGVMQTRFDYYSQYMFFVHRGQHLVLHHLGPFLIALSNPLPVLQFWHRRLGLGHTPLLRPLAWIYRVLQHPLVAPVLFAGLVYFWLWPAIHFDAMLSRQLYWIMNWSMLLDGILFWWLIFDPRSPAAGEALGYGKRMLLLAVVAIPQLILGAWIVFSRGMVYDVYEVCGRAWPMAPETDQLLGGLLTWIPPGMMSVLGILIILRRAMHQNDRTPHPANQGMTP